MGILNSLTASAEAAYSLRKLLTAYAGSSIRVRRSSDNTESDIGFDGSGNLDTSALLTFIGTGGTDNGFIVTWYDQSGNAYNATQPTRGNQPQIVSAGAVLVDTNLKPWIDYDGAGDCLQKTTFLTDLAQPNTINLVSKADSLTAEMYYFDSGGASNKRNAYITTATPNHFYFSGLSVVGGTPDTNHNILTTLFNSPNSDIFLNRTSLSLSGNTGSSALSGITVGARYNSVSYFNGKMQEFIIFDSALSTTDRETLEADQDAYWINPTTGATYTQSVTNIVSSSTTVSKSSKKIISNTVSGAISITKSITKAINNTVSSTVNVIKSTRKSISNSIALATSVLTNLITVIYYVTISNSVSSATSVSKSMTKIISNLTSVDTTLLKSTSKIFSNLVSADTSVIKRISKAIANNINSATTTVKSISKSISNTISAATSVLTNLITTVIYYVTLSNSVSSSTSVTKAMSKSIRNNVSVSLSVIKKTTKIIVNTVSCFISRVRDIVSLINNVLYTFTLRDRIEFIVTKNRSVNMLYFQFSKQSDEIIPIAFNCSKLLQSTESISSIDVKAYYANEDVSSAIIEDYVIDEDVIKVRVKGGDGNKKYKITVKATTDESNIYEVDVFMNVKNI